MKIDVGGIIEGVRNRTFPPDEIKALIARTVEERSAICDACDLNSAVAKKKGNKFHSSWRPDIHCINCQCNLNSKQHCLSCQCPLEKWLAVATDVEEEEIDKALEDGQHSK